MPAPDRPSAASTAVVGGPPVEARAADPAHQPPWWSAHMDLRPDIALETAAEGDLAVVRLAGELDAATSPILRPKLLEEATRPAETTLDLEALRFCDAAGLRLLVEVTRQARAAGGSVRLRHLRPAVARVVEVTRCDQFLDIDDEP